MPAKVFALEPPLTVSVESLKLPLNRLDTVAPLGLAVSSFTAASVAVPLATGASFTALIVSDSATVALEICVVPPVAPVRLIVEPLVIARPLSIRFALNAVAGPLKFAAGTKRSKSVELSVIAVVVVALPRLVQLVPPLVEYAQLPFV